MRIDCSYKPRRGDPSGRSAHVAQAAILTANSFDRVWFETAVSAGSGMFAPPWWRAPALGQTPHWS